MTDIVKAFLSKIFDYGYSEADIDQMVDRFDINGLIEKDAVAALDITWPELRRWREDERFPVPNVEVLTWEWKGSGKYKKLGLVDGWTKELVEAVRPNIEGWRTEHKLNRKIKQPPRTKYTVALF
jgi:hypothetical protein